MLGLPFVSELEQIAYILSFCLIFLAHNSELTQSNNSFYEEKPLLSYMCATRQFQIDSVSI